MGRRRWNNKHPDKLRQQQQPRQDDVADPPSRLLSLQPNSSVVAVAIGTRVTLVDYKTGQEVSLASSTSAPASSATATADPAATPAASAPHAGSLRVLQFSPDGRCLLTGGDDKAARLWLAGPSASTSGDTATATAAVAWPCLAAWRTPKKMSAGGFNLGGTHALFADKFGDVLVGAVPASLSAAAAAGGNEAAPAAQQQLAAPGTLLGHFCSIVTGVAAAPCGRLLATSDKDYKIRISQLSSDLLQGSYEIQCYCLGHQDFVSCIGFAVRQQQGEAEAGNRECLLLSGSGDGTVRVWDHVTGAQLASYVAAAPVVAPAAVEGAGGGAAGAAAAAETAGGADASGADEGGEAASGAGDDVDDEAGEGEEDVGEEGPAAGAQGDGGGGGGDDDGGEPQRRSKAPPCAPVLSLAVSPDGCTVAVVVEGEDEVQLLTVDWAARSLTLLQRLSWPDVRYPCQAAFGPTGQLWVVGGVPLPSARSVHVGVAQRGANDSFSPCTDEVLAAPVRALLEARVAEEEAKMAEGGELCAYSKRYRKPEYDEANANERKRQRNDHKETTRLAALRQRQDKQAAANKQQAAEAEVEAGAVAEAEAVVAETEAPVS